MGVVWYFFGISLVFLWSKPKKYQRNTIEYPVKQAI
jgi:hypothetical protein